MKLALLASLVAIVTAAILGGFAYTTLVRSLKTETIQDNRHSVRAYADGLQTYLNDATQLLSVTAHTSGVVNFPRVARIEARLHGVAPTADTEGRAAARTILAHSNAFESILVLRGDGQILWVEPYALQRSLAVNDLTFLPWYRAITATKGVVVSDLHISPTTQRPTVTIAVPLVDAHGKLIAIYAGTLRLAGLSSFGRVPSGAKGASGYLTDSHGLIVADQTRPLFVTYQTDASSTPPVRAGLQSHEGAGRWVSSLDQVVNLGAWEPLPGGWVAVYRTSESVALAPAASLTKTFAISSGIVALVLALLSSLLVRRIVRPIENLTKAATEVARGELSTRVEGHGRDEVGVLSQTFNDMASSIERKDRELQRHAAMLEQVNAELDSFAYSVSHDLRAPLRSMDGFSQALMDDYADRLDEKGREYATRVQAASRRMGKLIDDLLRLSRISRAELNPKPINLSEIAQSIVRELAERDPERHVTTAIAPSASATADPRLVEILLDNIISNAWKFTAKTENARIEFGIGDEGGETFFVRDNGAGFDMAYADKLFAPFQRLHAAQEFEGTGIGLATALRIVRRHGGSISAVSEVGRGATFTFTLPRISALKQTPRKEPSSSQQNARVA